MTKPKNLEIKVGFFVIVAMACLSVFVISVSDLALFEKGQVVKTQFSFANGLKKASPVRFAGVDAGLVHEIDVVRDMTTGEQQVFIDLWLKEDLRIPKDSRVFINQLGLLGEKYIEIMPGISNESFAQHEIIRGDDPVAMESISKTIHDLAAKFDTTIDSVNEGVLSKNTQQSFSETLAGVNTLVKKINSGEGTVGRLLTNPSIHDNLEELTADLKENPWKLFYRPKGSKK